jgi:hypothetical protein
MEGTAKRVIDPETHFAQDWVEQELAASKLPNAQLEKRLQQLVEQMAAGLGRSIPLACQSGVATLGTYRFFSKERICEESILAGHYAAARERLPQGRSPVLALHDTTAPTYKREDTAAVGWIGTGSVRKDSQRLPVYFTTCGINLHTSLAITMEELSLGLTAVKSWSRKEFKGRKAKRKAHNSPLEEKEPWHNASSQNALFQQLLDELNIDFDRIHQLRNRYPLFKSVRDVDRSRTEQKRISPVRLLWNVGREFCNHRGQAFHGLQADEGQFKTKLHIRESFDFNLIFSRTSFASPIKRKCNCASARSAMTLGA